jgi:hypothetical protein
MFASFEAVPTPSCLNNGEYADPGHGSCPSATSGFTSSSLLLGPTPAGGAMVSNLYADTDGPVTATDTAVVAVIDNTTGATLLSCTVDSTSRNHCSNTSSGVAGAGDNLEVQVSANPSTGSGSNRQWRVRFRY